MTKYKGELVGINTIVQEESYTSKCDALALESIEKHEKYLGRRVKRGLFKSSTDRYINADIGGSLNILRKVIGDGFLLDLINRGAGFVPYKVNIY
jgi:putative transposase